MLGKAALLILIGLVSVTAEDFSRKDAKAQSRTFGRQRSAFAALRFCTRNLPVQSEDLTVEVFQVLDLPLSVHEASLVKTDRAFFLRLSLGNSTELRIVGLRYSLVTIDSKNQLQFVANRVEG